MRWSIRYQLLVPLATLLLGVLGISSWTALASAGRARQQMEKQVRDVARTLAAATFPLTPHVLDQMKGLAVSRDHIEEIRCYLTGGEAADGKFSITRYQLHDKHGLSHTVYNAKINIHLQQADPIYLGLQHRDLNPPGATLHWPDAH